MKKRLLMMLLAVCMMVTAIGTGCGNGATGGSTQSGGNGNTTKSAGLKIEDFAYEISQGVVDGDRYELMSLTNNSPYTICGFGIEFKAKSDVTQEQKDKFFGEIQESYKFDDATIENVKKMTTWMHVETERVLKSGESQDNVQMCYFQGIFYMKNDDHYQLVEPDIAKIKYIDGGKIYTAYYDFASKKFSKDSKTEAVDQWSDKNCGSLVPKPEAEIITSSYDSDTSYHFAAYRQTVDDFNKYVESCKEKGFTEGVYSNNGYYSAKDSSGNSIIVDYSEEKEAFDCMVSGK